MKKTCSSCNRIRNVNWFDENAEICNPCTLADEFYECSKCGNEVPGNLMYFDKGTITHRCYQCQRGKDAVRALRHYHKTKGNKTEEQKARYKAYQKEYNKKNAPKIALKKKLYEQKNRDKINADRRIYNALPHRKIRNSLHNRLGEVLSKANCAKTINTVPLLGCSISVFLKWLEYQFLDGMTLQNHGKWHLDHCKPCAAFDLTLENEQKECFHWTNMQPLWGADNISKSDYYTQADLDIQAEKVRQFLIQYFGTENPEQELLWIDSFDQSGSLSIPLLDGKPTDSTSAKVDKKIVFELTTISLDEVDGITMEIFEEIKVVTHVTMEVFKEFTCTIPPHINDLDDLEQEGPNNELLKQIKALDNRNKKKKPSKPKPIFQDHDTVIRELYPEKFRKQSGYGNNSRGLGNQRQMPKHRNVY